MCIRDSFVYKQNKNGQTAGFTFLSFTHAQTDARAVCFEELPETLAGYVCALRSMKLFRCHLCLLRNKYVLSLER